MAVPVKEKTLSHFISAQYGIQDKPWSRCSLKGMQHGQRKSTTQLLLAKKRLMTEGPEST
jgi:hypothetical protein